MGSIKRESKKFLKGILKKVSKKPTTTEETVNRKAVKKERERLSIRASLNLKPLSRIY